MKLKWVIWPLAIGGAVFAYFALKAWARAEYDRIAVESRQEAGIAT